MARLQLVDEPSNSLIYGVFGSRWLPPKNDIVWLNMALIGLKADLNGVIIGCQNELNSGSAGMSWLSVSSLWSYVSSSNKVLPYWLDSWPWAPQHGLRSNMLRKLKNPEHCFRQKRETEATHFYIPFWSERFPLCDLSYLSYQSQLNQSYH